MVVDDREDRAAHRGEADAPGAVIGGDDAGGAVPRLAPVPVGELVLVAAIGLVKWPAPGMAGTRGSVFIGGVRVTAAARISLIFNGVPPEQFLVVSSQLAEIARGILEATTATRAAHPTPGFPPSRERRCCAEVSLLPVFTGTWFSRRTCFRGNDGSRFRIFSCRFRIGVGLPWRRGVLRLREWMLGSRKLMEVA